MSTSIVRLGGDAAELEVQLMRAFRKYAAADATTHDTPWDWLALGQYGLSSWLARYYAPRSRDG